MKRKLLMFIIATLVSIIIGILGYYYYEYEKEKIYNERCNDLKVISNLKINEIKDWKNLNINIAEVITKDPLFINNIETYLKTYDPSLKEVIYNRLMQLKFFNEYSEVYLTYNDGRAFISSNKEIERINSAFLPYIKSVYEEKVTLFSDFHECDKHKKIHLAIISPIINKENEVIASLFIYIDPTIYLYPLIQNWPIDSKTGEIILFVREDDNVLYLNELRYKKNTALKFRVPLTQKSILSVKAVLGEEGISEGLDYRGEKVIGYLSKIPTTPWFIIAKIDKSEIFEELIYRSVGILIIVILLILYTSFTTALIYYRDEKEVYKKLFQKEKDLAEALEEFRVILYSIGDGVISTDSQGNVKVMNSIAEQLTEYSEIEARGKKLEEIFPIVNEETGVSIKNPVERVLKEGKVFGLANHTLLISRSGKRYPIADSAAPIFNNKGEIIGVILVFRDQTKERWLKSQILQSQKLQALGTLAGGIAHDFNNIFAIIMGYSSLLELGKCDPEKLKTSIWAIKSASERGALLIKQLLTFANRTERKLEPIKIDEIALDVITFLKDTFPETILINSEIEENLPIIYGDKTDIRQLFLNICLNARDAMPKGGTLSISLKSASPQILLKKFPQIEDENYIEIKISDTGCGMDEETSQRIFEPFFTTKDVGKGSGLGLSLVYSIVQSHKGFIHVESKLNKGTTFYVYLPVNKKIKGEL